MLKIDWSELISAAFFLITGVFIVTYSLLYLPLGTLRQMGAGMFPTLVGTSLAGLGLVLVVPALSRAGGFERPDWRSLFAILAGIGAFALCVARLGLIPAICILVAVSSMASSGFKPARVLMLSTILSLLAYVVFVMVLDAPLSMVKVPG